MVRPERAAAPAPGPAGADSGSALAVVLLLLALILAISLGGALVARFEMLVSSRYRHSAAAFYAADAGIEAAIAELRPLPEWSDVVGGVRSSAWSRGTSAGSGGLPGGVVSVCCGAGSMSDRLAVETRQSSRAARRALQWRPFLWNTLASLSGRAEAGSILVVVWVANDEDDRAGGAAADTNDTVLVRSEAVDPRGVRRIVEAVVGRPPVARGGGLYSEGSTTEEARLMQVGILGWREVR